MYFSNNATTLTIYFMNRVITIIILLVLYSCKDERIEHYERLVNNVDSMLVSNPKSQQPVAIMTSPMLESMKEILKRNIQPEPPRKIVGDLSITLYSGGRLTGFILISTNASPYATFYSNSLNISFPLTYGIGMSLDHWLQENTSDHH